MQSGELALKTAHALLLHLHILGEFSLTHLDLFDAPLETLKSRLMLLLVLRITRLLGALVHGQGAIPLHAQILQFLGERLALEAFLFEDGLQLPKSIEQVVVAPNQLVTLEIKGIGDPLSRPGEHAIGSPHQAELLAQSVERD